MYRLPQSRRGLGIQVTHYPLDFPLYAPYQPSYQGTNPSFAGALTHEQLRKIDLDEDGYTTLPDYTSQVVEDTCFQETSTVVVDSCFREEDKQEAVDNTLYDFIEIDDCVDHDNVANAVDVKSFNADVNIASPNKDNDDVVDPSTGNNVEDVFEEPNKGGCCHE